MPTSLRNLTQAIAPQPRSGFGRHVTPVFVRCPLPERRKPLEPVDSALRWEARSRTRTDDPFLTIDLDEEKTRTRPDTSGTRLSRKAAAFVEWLSAGGDGVCTI
jgi:hypothetical protein